MRLFHKFLIALLAISIIPLIIYSIILLATTGSTLKKVIDQNNINIVGNVTLEVNKYFGEIEKKLDAGRQIERVRGMKSADKGALLYSALTSNKLLTDIALLDDNNHVLNAMSSSESVFDMDRPLLERARSSGQVEMGVISYTPSNRPYVDVVYPIGGASKEYLYLRASINYLLHRVALYLNNEKGRDSMMITLIDGFGGMVRTTGGAMQKLDEAQLARFREVPENTVRVEKGKVLISAVSSGPGWLVVFNEPASEAYGPITAMKVTAVLLIVLTAGLSFYGAFLLAKNLARPIGAMVAGIETVASGNMDYQIPPLAEDELSRLVVIFNGMTQKLKKLQDDMKRSERLSTIGQMANILGHEIRNPLAAITNATYLIKLEASKNPDANPKTFKRIEIIENEIKSTIKIINDMLDYSRSRPPVLSRQDLNQVIKDITAESKMPENVPVEYKFNDASPVAIDVEEMKQVIRNLINNAVDSMSAAGGTLTIRTTSMTGTISKAPAICLEIADSGCGIPKEILEKIWEPFFSTKSKGTGLGLAVVKRIVEERHKGYIRVHSIKNKGTSFYVELPVAV